MHPRSYRSTVAFIVSCLVLGASAAPALAAGERDKDAQALLDKAMGEDYLAVEFGKAEKKLTDALKRCGKDGCSKPMLGKIDIALGTVYANMSPPKPDDAKNQFASALEADPGAALDPSFKGPDTDKLFKAAQAAAGITSAPAPAPTPVAPKPDAEPEKPKKAGGDIPYTPTVTEQLVNTPIPIYIDVPQEAGAEKATLKYKPFGATAWKSVEMKKLSGGFGVEIPCEDVTTTGDLKYYVVAKDAAGDPSGTAGSPMQPYTVTVKNQIEGQPPALPGSKAPDQCKAKEDCPPGLLGCPGKPGKHGAKGWGDSCEASEECKAGFVCVNGGCEEGKEGQAGDESTSGKQKMNFLSLGIGTDLLFMGGSTNICSGGTGDDTHSCFQQSDSSQQFFGRPAVAGNTNGIAGGIAFAGPRILIGYDRVLSEKIPFMLGLRLGAAFGAPSSPSNQADCDASGNCGFRSSSTAALGSSPGVPQSAAHKFFFFHYEGRIGYQLGKFEPKKFRGVLFVNGGGAQVSASVPVTVCDTVQYGANGQAVALSPSSYDTTGACKGTGKATKLNAYQITGLNFVGGGGNLTYGLSENFGLTAELKLMVMLPTTGVALEPMIGATVGF